jgi:hypothetical protein
MFYLSPVQCQLYRDYIQSWGVVLGARGRNCIDSGEELCGTESIGITFFSRNASNRNTLWVFLFVHLIEQPCRHP